VVVAVDVGTVRVGVAASDPDRVLASPVETVPAPGHARVAEIVAEREAVLVVVGLPTSLSGAAHSASRAAALRASGRSARTGRALVDQAAAVALLQGVLDSGR
jgi:putative holliday junction resolvase